MARTCTVCTNPDREQIDLTLVSGESLRVVGTRFGLTSSSLQRHRTAHIPATIRKAASAAEIKEGAHLLDRLKTLNRETAAILREARKEGAKNNDLALKAIARAEKQIEMEGRLLGDLKEGSTINVLLTPEWTAVRGAILKALDEYPAAKTAVAGALSNVGA